MAISAVSDCILLCHPSHGRPSRTWSEAEITMSARKRAFPPISSTAVSSHVPLGCPFHVHPAGHNLKCLDSGGNRFFCLFLLPVMASCWFACMMGSPVGCTPRWQWVQWWYWAYSLPLTPPPAILSHWGDPVGCKPRLPWLCKRAENLALPLTLLRPAIVSCLVTHHMGISEGCSRRLQGPQGQWAETPVPPHFSCQIKTWGLFFRSPQDRFKYWQCVQLYFQSGSSSLDHS